GVLTRSLSTPGVFLPALTCVTLLTDMRMLEWQRSMSFWSERTLRRSFACVARKMRPLRLRTMRSALRQSMASQAVPIRPSGPFAAPECCIELVPRFAPLKSYLGVSTRPTAAAFWPRPRGPIHRVMDSPCLSAGGLRFLGHRVPAAGLGLPSEDRRAYWPVGQTATGLPCSALVSSDGVGCLLYCGAGVSLAGAGAASSPLAQASPWLSTIVFRRPSMTQP